MRELSVAALCLTAFIWTTSCARQPDDVSIVKSVQTRIQIVSGEVKVESTNGFVTLSGHVSNDAERALAAREATGTTGVKGVFNYLTIEVPATANSRKIRPNGTIRRPRSPENPASPEPPAQPDVPVAAVLQPPPSDPPAAAPAPSIAPPPPATSPVQVAPPAPPVPVKHVVQSGTVLSVRLIDSLDSARNKEGDTFRATLKVPLTVDGDVVIPAGADVEGRVAEVSNAGRFSGHSELNLELTKLTSNGTVYPLQTQGYDRSGNSRGKGTAETVGGGAVLGAIIGAIAGGGKGAGIGTAAGAGAGGATRAATPGKRITFPSETVLTFKLQQPLTVVSKDESGGNGRTPVGQ